MLQARDERAVRELRAAAEGGARSDGAADGSARFRPTSLAVDLGAIRIGELSDLVADHTMAVRRAEAAVLDLACAWADRFPAHHPRSCLSRKQRAAALELADELTTATPGTRYSPTVTAPGDRPIGAGGDGTPDVSVFAIAELAVLRRTSIAAGHALVADALDLRHRLPLLDQHARAGELPLGMARRAATRTRHLTAEQAGDVDRWLAESAPGLGWARFTTLLEAAVIEVDPAMAAERARAAAQAQEVWARPDEHGLATLVARIDAGDATILLAMVARLADILRRRPGGDQLTAGERRARALGLLGRPLQALALLAGEHVDGVPDTYDAEVAIELEQSGRVPAAVPAGPVIADPRVPDPDRPLPPEPVEPDPPERVVELPRGGPPVWSGRYSPAPDDPGEPGGLERDLAALIGAVPAAGMDLARWIRRAWKVGAPKTTLVYHLADVSADKPDDGEACPPQTGQTTTAPLGPTCSDPSRTDLAPPGPARPEDAHPDARHPGLAHAGAERSEQRRAARGRSGLQPTPTQTSAEPIEDEERVDRVAEPVFTRPADGYDPPAPARSQSGTAPEKIIRPSSLGTSSAQTRLVRPEHRHGGPLTLDQLTDHLGASGARVTVRPVVDPAETAAVDGYEIPHRVRFAVRTRHPASVFPWSACLSPGMDLDHTRPYQPDAPPGSGQTAVDKLGPVARCEHNAKTHGGFAVRQPVPGHHLWRTPTGHHYLVSNQGTTALGRGTAAQRLWDAARNWADG